MSGSKKAWPSHRRSGIMLDAGLAKHMTCDIKGSWTELGEYLPCMILNGFPLRVALEGLTYCLYYWDDETEVWEEVAESQAPFRLSTVVPILDNYFYIVSLAEEDSPF